MTALAKHLKSLLVLEESLLLSLNKQDISNYECVDNLIRIQVIIILL